MSGTPQLTQYQNGPIAVSGDGLNTFVQSCDTAMQMRQFIGGQVKSLYARGIDAVDDGLGGPFFWNPTSIGPDDDLNVIVPFGAKVGAWVRNNQPAPVPVGGVQTVANIAALRALATAASPLWVEGYYTSNDGGEGMFILGHDGSDNGGTIILSADGTYYRETGSKPLSVKWFGAKGDGSTDDTAAFRATVATGQPVYIPPATYVITDAITPPGSSQLIFGAGRGASIISVPATFAPAALGVFALQTSEPGPILRDFLIKFTQPDTAVRANLHTYPPAIYAVGCSRFRAEHMGVWNATVGINMTGNAGGAYIDDFQCSAYTASIEIDGALDTVRISRPHIWPFGMTANQQTIFFNSATLGISSGRCDGLYIDSPMILCGTQINLFNGASGDTFGGACNGDFDTSTSLVMSQGDFSLTGCTLTMGIANSPLVFLTGGVLRMTGCEIFSNQSSTFPLIDVDNAASSLVAELNMSNCTFDTGAHDVSNINVNGTGILSQINVSNCTMSKDANVAYTRPAISGTGTSSRLSLANNRCTDKGAGAGTFISIATDNFNRVIGNVSPGWTNSFPVAVSGVYQFN
jgi:hypothetical protein